MSSTRGIDCPRTGEIIVGFTLCLMPIVVIFFTDPLLELYSERLVQGALKSFRKSYNISKAFKRPLTSPTSHRNLSNVSGIPVTMTVTDTHILDWKGSTRYRIRSDSYLPLFFHCFFSTERSSIVCIVGHAAYPFVPTDSELLTLTAPITNREEQLFGNTGL